MIAHVMGVTMFEDDVSWREYLLAVTENDIADYERLGYSRTGTRYYFHTIREFAEQWEILTGRPLLSTDLSKLEFPASQDRYNPNDPNDMSMWLFEEVLPCCVR